MIVIVNVRKRGSIGIFFPMGFEIPKAQADEGLFELWQPLYGNEWEPGGTVSLPGKCARTACDVPNAVCNHTMAPYRLYCPKCARAINEHTPGLVEFPRTLREPAA